MIRSVPRASMIFVAALLFLFIPSIASSADQGTGTQQGLVLETTNASGYTYLHLDTGSEKLWVAIPETQVEKGKNVSFIDGMTMNDFYSKTLDRTFTSIIFSPGLENNSPQVAKAAEPQEAAPSSFAEAIQQESNTPAESSSMPSQVSGGSSGAAVPMIETSVEKLEGENSYTVAEIFNQADQLNGKKIRIRGRVVKFSPNIMGKNWVHIQDGTGDPMKNTHDMVVTTVDTTSVDQVVVVEGMVTAKKDFGFGYKYDALIEEATISQ